MNAAKQAIYDLVEICEKKGLKNVVISPGSRNAPIADEFLKRKKMNCFSIVDERSAGFFALGIAQQTGKATVLLCTSGSAVLNYAPAIAEGFYQKVPLLVLTADRPREWIGQGESQTIDQYNIFANYIKKSFQLKSNPVNENGFWFNARCMSEAINLSVHFPYGPVHLNLSLDEPLYAKSEITKRSPKTIEITPVDQFLGEPAMAELKKELNHCKKILLLTGSMLPDKKLNELLNRFSQSAAVAIFTETTGNVHGERFFPCIDRLLATILPGEERQLKPDLLITFGDQVISKRIKAFLRTNRPAQHWHVDPTQLHFDTYQSQSRSIPVTPVAFLEQLLQDYTDPGSDYHQQWASKNEHAGHRHKTFLSKSGFSDLKALEHILQNLPGGSQLQMGNSSPVRYVQLFDENPSVRYFSNRGTSGIEGCTSTAAGAAWADKGLTTLITGDIGFFYDANGLWNNYLSPKFRIIVINNSGGGIFRFIEGPDTVEDFETFIETNHHLTAELLAKLHGLFYFYAENEQELKTALKQFYDPGNDRCSILEVKTPRLENASILRAYFEYLNKGE